MVIGVGQGSVSSPAGAGGGVDEAIPDLASASGESARREIDALIGRFYAAFDNRAGRAPAEEALRASFTPGATITRVSLASAETWSPEEFISPRIAMLTDGSLWGFHEWEIGEATSIQGRIASRESTYQKEGRLRGAPLHGTGRKLIQLHRGSGSWLISSILWQDE